MCVYRGTCVFACVCVCCKCIREREFVCVFSPSLPPFSLSPPPPEYPRCSQTRPPPPRAVCGNLLRVLAVACRAPLGFHHRGQPYTPLHGCCRHDQPGVSLVVTTVLYLIHYPSCLAYHMVPCLIHSLLPVCRPYSGPTLMRCLCSLFVILLKSCWVGTLSPFGCL